MTGQRYLGRRQSWRRQAYYTTIVVVLAALVPKNVLLAHGKRQPTACADTGMTQWMLNDHGKTPCELAQEVMQICNSTWRMPWLSVNYTCPNTGKMAPCCCGSPTFALFSACWSCQYNGTFDCVTQTFTEFEKACPIIPNPITSYDRSLQPQPSTLHIPSWALIEPKAGKWDFTDSWKNTTPGSTIRPPIPTGLPLSPPSSGSLGLSRDLVIVIVIGSVVITCLFFIIGLMLFRRWSIKQSKGEHIDLMEGDPGIDPYLLQTPNHTTSGNSASGDATPTLNGVNGDNGGSVAMREFGSGAGVMPTTLSAVYPGAPEPTSPTLPMRRPSVALSYSESMTQTSHLPTSSAGSDLNHGNGNGSDNVTFVLGPVPPLRRNNTSKTAMTHLSNVSATPTFASNATTTPTAIMQGSVAPTTRTRSTSLTISTPPSPIRPRSPLPPPLPPQSPRRRSRRRSTLIVSNETSRPVTPDMQELDGGIVLLSNTSSTVGHPDGEDDLHTEDARRAVSPPPYQDWRQSRTELARANSIVRRGSVTSEVGSSP